MPYGGLGDMLCLIAAARMYGLKHGCKVYVHAYPEVQKAYGDYEKWGSEAPIPGARDVQVHAAVVPRHRVKNDSPDFNYYGTFLAALGIPAKDNYECHMQLPELPPPKGLKPHSYVALQPYSTFARNPEPRDPWVQAAIDTVAGLRRKYTVDPEWSHEAGKHIVCVGAPNTRKDLKGLDYNYLGGPLELLAVVQHADYVLTPRSVTAHVAAAYSVESFVWLPGDGEDWHLRYPRWPVNWLSVDTEVSKVPERLHALWGNG